MSDDCKLSDVPCPKCGNVETRQRRCECNGVGYCAECCSFADECDCEEPEHTACLQCDNGGWVHWCPKCGWDLVMNEYLNGRDESKEVTT